MHGRTHTQVARGMWHVHASTCMWDVGCGMWDVACGMWHVHVSTYARARVGVHVCVCGARGVPHLCGGDEGVDVGAGGVVGGALPRGDVGAVA